MVEPEAAQTAGGRPPGVYDFVVKTGRARLSRGFRAAVYIVACGAPAVMAQDAFTVRDSIEMARILNLSGEDRPGSVAWYAPSGARFVIHARRGDLARNRSVESLLLFETRQVESYLAERDRGTKPSPRVLVQRDVEDDWGEMSSIQWLNDSEVGFISQGGGGVNQVFIANVTGQVTQLTRSATPVASFAASQATILYYAHLPVVPLPLVNALGDKGIGDLLFPDDAISRPVELFQVSRSSGSVQRVRASAVRLFDKTLWISPSGLYALSFAPAVNAPAEWVEYRMPDYDLFGYTRERIRSDPTSPDLEFRLRYQLIDLKNNAVRSLLDAPSGTLYRNRTPVEVFWPRGNQSVIVSSTYLPLGVRGTAMRDRRRTGPAIAEINLKTGVVIPILWEPVITKDMEAGRARLTPIVSIEWNDEASTLTVTTRSPLGEVARESIQKRGGAWRSIETRNTQRAPKPEILRRETLNERPRVYATGGACTCSKELFDPAPQADQFTFGWSEIFRWKDGNDIEWHGGLLYPVNYVAGRRYPLIVQTHGFMPDEFLVDGPSGGTTAMAAQAFANAGFVVLQVEDNRRATTHDEREGSLYAEGYRAAVAGLVEQGIVDAAKVGLIGFSRTVRYAIQLVAQHPDLLAAITLADGSWWGYMNELLSMNMPQDVAVQLRQLRGSTPAEVGLADWLAGDPIYRLPQAKTAVRIEAMGPGTLLGMWEAYAVLRQANRPVEYIYFPEGSHVLKKSLERVGSQGGNVDWFRFWLQGYEDPSPAKVEQYKRWRALRWPQRKGKMSRGQ